MFLQALIKIPIKWINYMKKMSAKIKLCQRTTR